MAGRRFRGDTQQLDFEPRPVVSLSQHTSRARQDGSVKLNQEICGIFDRLEAQLEAGASVLMSGEVCVWVGGVCVWVGVVCGWVGVWWWGWGWVDGWVGGWDGGGGGGGGLCSPPAGAGAGRMHLQRTTVGRAAAPT